MRGTRERSGKPEVRWDSVGTAGWLDKQAVFTEYHQNNLLKICANPEFLVAVNEVADWYLSRQKPEAPSFAKFRQEYRKKWVRPTFGDMKATFFDLKKTKNKVKQLNEISRCHPIWDVIKNAWYEEHKRQLDCGYFKRVFDIADFHYMLETTPDDHPQKSVMIDIWTKDHKTDFEKLNAEFIPNLIDVSLKHLKDVHLTTQTDSATEKRWLGWRLAIILQRFGIKPTQVKDGPLSLCIGIVLDAVGKPTANPHKYIIPEMIKELKKTTPL